MPVTALDTLRDRVEALLKDASNADWSTAELDDAIRMALHELSGALPAHDVTTKDAVTDQYEYDISTITGLVGVVEVWYPYLATDDEYKTEHACKWRMITDTKLMIDPEDTPDAAYDLRIFYDVVQTLAGLDSAAATTLTDEEKSILIIGAAGFAAVALGRDKIDTVTFGEAAEDLRKWGWARLAEFRSRLAEAGDREAAGDEARIGWWSADKWDV